MFLVLYTTPLVEAIFSTEHVRNFPFNPFQSSDDENLNNNIKKNKHWRKLTKGIKVGGPTKTRVQT